MSKSEDKCVQVILEKFYNIVYLHKPVSLFYYEISQTCSYVNRDRKELVDENRCGTWDASTLSGCVLIHINKINFEKVESKMPKMINSADMSFQNWWCFS